MKNIITLFAVVYALGLGAQSLELVNHKDTVYYYPSTPSLDVPAYITVKNASSSNNEYQVKRNGPFDQSCSINYFCWDLCYLPSDSVSSKATPIPIASGQDTSAFSGHILASGNGVEDCCEIVYTFFNKDDATDKLDVSVMFCGDVSLSVNENYYSLFSVFPNPANDFVNIEYTSKKDGSFQLFNVVGQSVFTQTLSAGDQRTTVDVSSLNSGVYFYTLQIEGNVMETKKLIIK